MNMIYGGARRTGKTLQMQNREVLWINNIKGTRQRITDIEAQMMALKEEEYGHEIWISGDGEQGMYSRILGTKLATKINNLKNVDSDIVITVHTPIGHGG